MAETVLNGGDSSAPLEPPKGALMAIFLIILVDFLGFGLIIPLLPFYIPGYEHQTFQVTLLFSIYSICQFIGAPILGAMSDRYGRRPVLILSQIGSAAGYLLLGLATVEHFHWSPEMRLFLVYVSRVVDGFTGGNVSTAQAYISDVTTAKNRAKGMGLIGAAFGIGFCLGPFLGGVLGGFDRSWPAYAAAIFAFLAATQTYFKLPEPRVHKPTEVKAWLHPSTFTPVLKNTIVSQLLLISFISMAAFVMMETTAGIYLAQLFQWNDPETAARRTGWFFGYAGLVIVIVQGGLIGRLTKRVGEWPLAIAGALFVTVGMGFFVGTAYVPGLLMLGIAGAVNATGRSLQGPTISSLLSKFSDPKQQGVVFGLSNGLLSMARVLGPMLAWATYDYWRHTGQFWTAGAILLIAAAWTVVVKAQARVRGGGGFEPVITEEAVARAATGEIE